MVGDGDSGRIRSSARSRKARATKSTAIRTDAPFLGHWRQRAARLVEAAAAGASRDRAKRAEATAVAKLHAATVDQALGTARTGRIGEHDLTAILAH
jgi:hypothetical protein